MRAVDFIAGEKAASPSIPMVISVSLGGSTDTAFESAIKGALFFKVLLNFFWCVCVCVCVGGVNALINNDLMATVGGGTKCHVRSLYLTAYTQRARQGDGGECLGVAAVPSAFVGLGALAKGVVVSAAVPF